MQAYFDYKSKMMNKGADVDGYYGWQCWDGYADYCRYLGKKYANCTVSGYAKDVWEQRATNGALVDFFEVPKEQAQAGDVVVFKEYAGWTPVSHIAIFDSNAGGGYAYIFGQNQGSTITHPNGGSAFNLVKMPYDAFYPTVLRPKGDGSTTPKTAVQTNPSSSFLVKVEINNLNLRDKPSLSGKVLRQAPKGVYTIVETKEADGYEWGRFKAGGWVALKYTLRLNK